MRQAGERRQPLERVRLLFGQDDRFPRAHRRHRILFEGITFDLAPAERQKAELGEPLQRRGGDAAGVEIGRVHAARRALQHSERFPLTCAELQAAVG